jgi:murein DD-endopeptidase MepM/ murein hydrolase activator NlpD/acyl-CoA-binding protein
MSKNVIHNFDLSIKNSADIKSSEELTKAIIKELAKVSQEMNQQKDIVQLWQEQKNQNAIAVANSSSLPEGGATDNEKLTLVSNTPSASGEIVKDAIPSGIMSIPNALIGGGVADNTSGTIMTSATSVNTTSPTSGMENNSVNLNNGITTQTYANVSAQQTLTVPQILQTNEPTIEVVKAEIKKKLDAAIAANDTTTINYWTSISKAFGEGATVQDFDGKPNDMLFTQMYAILKQSNSGSIATQNFDWDIVRKKMIESIDTNILSGKISEKSKNRWITIQKQLMDDKTNVANLFEQYDELFLLLKEVEGLDALPNTITITTKTKIYPNLSADKLYAAIGKKDVYVFLKEISDIQGSVVNKSAVKIKNTEARSFIIGESLEFFLDEKFVNQNLYKKENTNWIVRNIQNKKDEGIVFVDKGTSLSYNFDTAGVYRIDAYENNATINGNKNARASTFIQLEIVTQQIVIKSPFKESVTRTSVKEQLFKVALKYPKVQPLNPLKLYYQVETKTANTRTKISEERELSPTGIIKLAMPDLGEYKIKVSSKDQYALAHEYKINAIKNEVTSIGQVEKTSNNGIFLLGDKNSTLTLEAKTFRINPGTDEEKEDVKWIIYDANNKPYLPPETVILTKNKDPKKTYFHQWGFYNVPIPQKVGHYTVEAYSDIQKGTKAKSVFKMKVMQPQVTEAYWAFSGGSKKRLSGFEGESNWIKANIPYYSNRTVRIYFYLDTIKTNYYCDVITNENGEIFEKIKFDSDFKTSIGFQNSKAKIGFRVLGIQNGKPYPFKTPANYKSDTVLSVTTDTKILDAYFMYDGNRVTVEDEIPFDKKGTTVTIVAKTQNMAGKDIVLTAHKVGKEPVFRHRVIVNSEGVATTKFDIMSAKGLKNGAVNKYYVGIEGYPTKHLTDKMINMVVGSGKTNESKKGIIDENNPQLIWGSKVSKEFRIKVVEIAKKLKVDPNWIMIIIAKETILTFDPHIDNGVGYVGLIQFSEDSAGEVGTTQAELKRMTAETQLNYVEKRFEKLGKKGYKSLTDLYLAVLNPTSVGQGDKDSNVLWTSKRMAYYNNASYHKEKGEYDHKIIKKGKTKRGFDEGTTYMWEVREELEIIEREGQKFEKMLKALPLELKYKNWDLKEITSGYGKRDVEVGSKFHKGLDFNYSGGGDTDIGAPVFSTHDGFIYKLKDDASGTTGRFVVIRSEDNSFQTRYLHLSKVFIKQDEKIKKGQKIGELGGSYNGKEKGGDINAHLHYEIMTLEKKGKENVYNQIDPTEGHGKNKAYVIDPQDWIK